MRLLNSTESRQWTAWRDQIASLQLSPSDLLVQDVRPGLRTAFHYFIGTYLLAKGHGELGRSWIESGIDGEPGGLFSNAFLTSFLNRTNGRLLIPETVFEDARPFVHFAGVPVMRDSRIKFVVQCGAALAVFPRPLRIMDIGCGHGELLVDLLNHLINSKLVNEVQEILLIDPSAAMLDLARKACSIACPEATVLTRQSRIEQCSEFLDHDYDIALASLSYHHMPLETKELHLNRLKDRINTFILFELDANNDTPELYSPELAVSIYQAYGGIIDFVFSHDAEIAVALASIDKFLMSEAISLLTEPRGKRTDYHMLRGQWHEVFQKGLGQGFQCICDSMCYADENLGLFTMIYQKNG